VYLPELLRNYHNVEEAEREGNDLYSDAALLSRESLRFSPEIRRELEIIWR
jgi:hypothetical protein